MSAYLPPGTPVRVLRPDQPAHSTGVVAEVHNGAREVWVRHPDCTGWVMSTSIHRDGHVCGYQYDEIEEAT